MTKTAELEDVAAHLAEWLQQVAAGHEVVITHSSKPVARLLSATRSESTSKGFLDLPVFHGHQVLTPNFTSAEIADEMWSPT